MFVETDHWCADSCRLPEMEEELDRFRAARIALVSGRCRVERGWCQYGHARDAAGKDVTPCNDSAASWSIIGAMRASSPPTAAIDLATRWLRDAIADLPVVNYWLDWHASKFKSQEDAIAAFDAAIEAITIKLNYLARKVDTIHGVVTAS